MLLCNVFLSPFGASICVVAGESGRYPAASCPYASCSRELRHKLYVFVPKSVVQGLEKHRYHVFVPEIASEGSGKHKHV